MFRFTYYRNSLNGQSLWWFQYPLSDQVLLLYYSLSRNIFPRRQCVPPVLSTFHNLFIMTTCSYWTIQLHLSNALTISYTHCMNYVAPNINGASGKLCRRSTGIADLPVQGAWFKDWVSSSISCESFSHFLWLYQNLNFDQLSCMLSG